MEQRQAASVTGVLQVVAFRQRSGKKVKGRHCAQCVTESGAAVISAGTDSLKKDAVEKKDSADDDAVVVETAVKESKNKNSEEEDDDKDKATKEVSPPNNFLLVKKDEYFKSYFW